MLTDCDCAASCEAAAEEALEEGEGLLWLGHRAYRGARYGMHVEIAMDVRYVMRGCVYWQRIECLRVHMRHVPPEAPRLPRGRPPRQAPAARRAARHRRHPRPARCEKGRPPAPPWPRRPPPPAPRPRRRRTQARSRQGAYRSPQCPGRKSLPLRRPCPCASAGRPPAGRHLHRAPPPAHGRRCSAARRPGRQERKAGHARPLQDDGAQVHVREGQRQRGRIPGAVPGLACRHRGAGAQPVCVRVGRQLACARRGESAHAQVQKAPVQQGG